VFGDKFFWQEKGNLKRIYLLHCSEKNEHSKLLRFSFPELEPAENNQFLQNNNFMPP
jgi:hypothetical protein